MESTRVTRCIFDRFLAGESIEELSEDYDLSSADIQELLRIETFIKSRRKRKQKQEAK